MSVTVIIPTFNEAGNAVELLDRLCTTIEPTDRVLFVDDGDDELPDVVAERAEHYPQQIDVVRRSVARGRLGGAVVEGMGLADTELVVVCDGDLQHPPEAIPAMVEAAAFADVVVATRYREGGHAGGLSSAYRRAASRVTARLSHLLFPRKLAGCTDPMSGFFLVRRSMLNLRELRPDGFKVLLDVLVRADGLRLTEVPFYFGERTAGESSVSVAEAGRFVRQLARLRLRNRAIAFACVGASGVLPNLAGVALLTALGVNYVLASVLAIQVAIGWNFLGAELLVWHDRRAGVWHRRFAKFALLGETDLLRLPFIVLAVESLHLGIVVATLGTVALSFLVRFLLINRIVYRAPAMATRTPSEAVEELAA